MARWKRNTKIGGRDVPGHGWDPQSILKDASVAVDNDPPASPAISGPGFSWHKLPQQAQVTAKRRSPRILVGSFAVKPNATYPNPGLSKTGNPNHDPKTGEFSGGQPKTDLYAKRNQARVAGEDAMKALKEQLKNTRKDDASDGSEPAEYNNADGRPKWMQSPGQGGKDPVYRSQKPGQGGNQDALFSKNVNENSPTMIPVDPDSYYIW